jgi:hypothetical protein
METRTVANRYEIPRAPLSLIIQRGIKFVDKMVG